MDLRTQYKILLQVLEEARIINPGADPQTIVLPDNEVLLRRLGEAGIQPFAFSAILEQAEEFRRAQAKLRALEQDTGTRPLPPIGRPPPTALPTSSQARALTEARLNLLDPLLVAAAHLGNPYNIYRFRALNDATFHYMKWLNTNQRETELFLATVTMLAFGHQMMLLQGETKPDATITALHQRAEQLARATEMGPLPSREALMANPLPLMVAELAMAGLNVEVRVMEQIPLADAREAPETIRVIGRLIATAEATLALIRSDYPNRTQLNNRIAQTEKTVLEYRARLETCRAKLTGAGASPPPSPSPTPPSLAPQVATMNLTQMAHGVPLLLDVMNHLPPITTLSTAQDLENFNEPLNDYYEHHRDEGLPQLALAALEPRRLGAYTEYRLSGTKYTPEIEGRFRAAATRITRRTGLPYTWRELDEFAQIGLVPLTYELALLDITTHLDRFPPITDQNRAEAIAILEKMETVLDALDRYDQAIIQAGGSHLKRGSRLMREVSEIRAHIKTMAQTQPQATVREAPPASPSGTKAARERVNQHLDALVSLVREGINLFRNPDFTQGMFGFMGDPTTGYVDTITKQQRGEVCILHGRMMIVLITQFQDRLSIPDPTLQATIFRTTIGTALIARGLGIPFTPPTPAESRAESVPLMIAELALAGLREDLKTIQALSIPTNSLELEKTLRVVQNIHEAISRLFPLVDGNLPNQEQHTERIESLFEQIAQLQVQMVDLEETLHGHQARLKTRDAASRVSQVLARAAASTRASLKPKTATPVKAASAASLPDMPIITIAQILRKAGTNEDLGWWIDLTQALDATETMAINQWLIDHPEFIEGLRRDIAEQDEIDWSPLEEALAEHVAGYERIDASEDRSAHRSAMSANFKKTRGAARSARIIFEA